MATTRVVFRKFKEGDVIALFPDTQYKNYAGEWAMDSYQRVGQHGEAVGDIVSVTKLATKEEYAPLLAELEAIGYGKISVVSKLIKVKK